jgi:hypothetical protein
MQVLSVPKEFNLKRHYSSLHGEKFNKYDGEWKVAFVNDFKKKLKQQTGMFTKLAKVQTCTLMYFSHLFHSSFRTDQVKKSYLVKEV